MLNPNTHNRLVAGSNLILFFEFYQQLTTSQNVHSDRCR